MILKVIIFLVAIIAIVYFLIRNGKSKTILFKSILSGDKTVPPNLSAAIGTATLVFNKETKVCVLIVNYSKSLTAVSAHIHKGAMGVRGPIVIRLDHTQNPIKFTSPPLTAQQEADLKANLYYIDIGTERLPEGEIRGQLVY